MSPSLRALLAGVIDYAGLFPPANLPLDQAVRNFARYRAEPDSWMLARFVCPAKQLAELNTHRADLPETLSLSVLGTGVDGGRTTLPALVNEFCALRIYRGDNRQVHVDGFEVRLAASLFREAENEVAVADIVRAISAHVDNALKEQKLPLAITFYEVEADPDWSSRLETLIRILRQDPLRVQGLKVRSGGLTAAAFPTPQQIALAVTACRDGMVPLKLTAGLHHPIRHFDWQLRTKMHGFLNVFGAGVLAHARNLNQEQVEEIVADEDASHFFFEDDGFRWKDWRAGIEEIRAARQQLVTSFGSCSFDEPRDDLRALGLLP